MPSLFSFALHAAPTGAEQWAELAQRAEAAGFDALCVADHPGSTASPFVALATAAAVTHTIQLGTAVVNGGVRQPMDIASDVATLDLLSGGRAFLGLGAGHTPDEWEAIGRPYPTPTERIDRLGELLATVPRLVAGETVTFDGEHVRLHNASLAVNAGRPVPLLVGGGNSRLLRLGAELADIVEVGGTGRTLPDGHHHEARWSEADVDRVTRIVSDAAARAGRQPVIGALVQYVKLTDDPVAAIGRYLDRVAAVVPPEALPSPAAALACPYTLVGTVPDIMAKLFAVRDRWGITRYTVRALEPVAELIAALADSSSSDAEP
ncbi:MAG: TIGR03621 family F420-dependent LLM class oxidoreductase [Acidimicrobiales bacterium]